MIPTPLIIVFRMDFYWLFLCIEFKFNTSIWVFDHITLIIITIYSNTYNDENDEISTSLNIYRYYSTDYSNIPFFSNRF